MGDQDIAAGKKPDISIVVPTLNSSLTLPRLLRSIRLCSSPASLPEVIVVDSHSCDGTIGLAEREGAIVIEIVGDRAIARNVGAEFSSSDTLMFLDADMELTPGLLEVCQYAIQTFEALCIREVGVGGGIWAQAREVERAGCFRSLTFEAARCFRKSTFLRLGGYDSRVTGLEDPELQARLVESGATIGWVNTPLIHHEEGVTLRSYLRKRAFYGQADVAMKRMHPEWWRKMTSPTARMRAVLYGLQTSCDARRLYLLPLLILLRFAELILRASRLGIRTTRESA